MLINSHQNIIMTIVISLFLLFTGCDSSSTDSDSDNNNNGNQNQSASFESGLIGPDKSFSYIFEEEETVNYYCTIHTPDMTGEIIVKSNTEATERILFL